MSFQLPQLPYSFQALEPHISQKTLEFHHGKHHQAYVTNLNNLLKGTDLEGKSIEDVIFASAQSPDKASIFNNAAQVWNHTFFWNSMSPQGGGEMKEGPLKQALVKTFGSIEQFLEQFKQAAATQFGSGWAWLALNTAGDLVINKTSNADLPLTYGKKPLLTCDVWEHAYYLDYQNRRPDYLSTFTTHLINWDFAEQQFLGSSA
ncbi:MAG: superoxide dismutase [Alphaproteobacteria bacterium]